MPTSLTVDEHLDLLRYSGDRLGDLAESVDESTRVPTCPAWTVRKLLAHLTMVHRWATANVIGSDPKVLPNQTEIADTVDDIVGHYRSGLDALTVALAEARPDLEAMTFLNDAPAPRHFWARRQAHETTIHMIDVLSATIGRAPTVEEATIPVTVAVDGIDELLCGFFTRGRSKLYDGEEFVVFVQPSDSERRWLMRVAEKLTTTPASVDDEPTGAITLTGTAAELYLGLWNRGDEIVASGRPDLLDRWRAVQRVTWG